jgi:hypothetical protein
MDRRLFLLAALSLAGCATIPPQVAPADVALQELEPLYAAVAGREALAIRVASGGCTAKADFTFYVERRRGAATLAFARRRLDTCRAVAAGRVDLAFPWAELGLRPAEPVFLLNPLASDAP